MPSEQPQSWAPLRARRKGAEGVREHEALVEGVPDWLRSSLKAWIRGALTIDCSDYLYERERPNAELLRQMERCLHVSLDWRGGEAAARDAVVNEADPDVVLEVVDFLLSTMKPTQGSQLRPIRDLHYVFNEAGSAWDVAAIEPGHPDSGFQLIRRVAEEVAASARDAFERGRPGEHLRLAWVAAYGRTPRPSSSYREAVRAVEAAAKPVVSPKKDKATLGTIISDLRQAPHKWKVELHGADEGQVEAIRASCELLWKGQLDRHGTDNDAAPIEVSQAQAEAGVHLAVLLVHWFTGGVIKAR